MLAEGEVRVGRLRLAEIPGPGGGGGRSLLGTGVVKMVLLLLLLCGSVF